MKTTLHLKAKKISSLFALLKQTNLLIVFAFFMFLQTGFAQQATISPWKINKGEGIINASIGYHGNPIAYNYATIPSSSNSNWTPAPVDANGSINYSVQSILSYCLQQLDFTYFETFIQIPSNFNITDLKVSFSAADDGARAYIFNSSHPNGAFIGEIMLGQTAITANYASLAKAGEANRLVIVQFDDCPSGNNLTGAQVQVNGIAVPIVIVPPVQTLTILGGNGTLGTPDPYTDASRDGGLTWQQAFLSGSHPWGYVTGTNSWINFDPNREVGLNSTTDYRIRFNIPADFTNPTMAFQIKADNYATVWINGTLAIARFGGQSYGNSDQAVVQAMHAGINEITIKLEDTGGLVGLNYRIDLSMNSNQVPTIIPATATNTPPIANAGADQSINCALNRGNSFTLNGSASTDANNDALTYNWSENGITRATGVNPTVSLTAGVHNIVLTVTDSKGGSNQDVVVITATGDNVAPIITLNGNASQSINFGTTYTDAGATATDNCSSATVIVGGTVNTNLPGVYTLTYDATDASGNVATQKIRTVTVVGSAPVIVCPANITVNNDLGQCGAAVNYAATETVGLPASVITYDIAPGSSFAVGTTTVTATATNALGTSSCTFTVTVVDNTAPTVITKDITIVLDDEDGAAIVPSDIDNGSSDNCGFTLSLDITDFTCLNVGSNTVTLTGTDASGNTASATATVTVVDNMAPVIVAPADISVFATSASGAVVNYVAPIGTDNCSVTTVMTAGLADGSTFPLGTTVVTYTATDASGNTATSSFNVTVVGIAPVIVCPANITVSNDLGQCGANVNYAATETVGIPASTITYDIAPGSFFSVGTTSVTVTATNAVGTSSCTFTVTVNDTEAPTVITKPVTVTITNGVATITASQVNNGSTDNCGIASVEVSPNTFVCGDQGNHTVTLTVTDIHGNVATQTAVVTVLGYVPSISVNSFTAVPTQATNTIFLGYGPQSTTLSTVATGGTGFTYAWTSSTGEVVASVANPTVSPKLSTTYTVTVTNANGCKATASIYVCVIDARAIDSHGKSEGKVLVCHNEGQNSGRSHTIEISVNAVEKHLRLHGDTLGACGATCSTTYVEVVVENDDDDDDHNSHADNDDDDDHDNHADNDDDDHNSESKETKAVIYPNPVVDDFVVGLNQKGEGSVEIYDNKGNRIYKKDSKDLKGGVAFNMRGKKSGTYYAKVTCKGKVYTATIFKKE